MVQEEELIRVCLAQLAAMSVDFDEAPNDEYYGNVFQSNVDGSFEVSINLEWEGVPSNWVKAVSCSVTSDLKVTKCTVLELDDEGEINERCFL